jgi:glycosyltransferase involved in cell wall biosynthesis
VCGVARKPFYKVMRILMLSWEYPPRIVGGIARHVQELSEALAQLGMEVHVVTAAHPEAPAEAVENGVVLHRVGVPFTPSPATLLEQVYALNAAIESRAGRSSPNGCVQVSDAPS